MPKQKCEDANQISTSKDEILNSPLIMSRALFELAITEADIRKMDIYEVNEMLEKLVANQQGR